MGRRELFAIAAMEPAENNGDGSLDKDRERERERKRERRYEKIHHYHSFINRFFFFFFFFFYILQSWPIGSRHCLLKKKRNNLIPYLLSQGSRPKGHA